MRARHAGTDKAKNTVVLGLLAGWLGFVREALAGRDPQASSRRRAPRSSSANERAFAAGRRYAAAHPLRARAATRRRRSAPADRSCSPTATRCARAAAIFAGCTFFGGYPITPSTEIMQFLGREIWKYGGAVLQAEDEIAGIGAVVGASFAGKKAMTATSGPGMSLKTEMLGLATHRRAAAGVRERAARRALDRHADQERAVGPLPGRLLGARRRRAPGARADQRRPTRSRRRSRPSTSPSSTRRRSSCSRTQEIAQRKEVVDPIDTRAFTVVERRRPTAAELEDYERFAVTESGISPISHPGMPGGNYLGVGHRAQRARRADRERRRCTRG